MPLHIVLCEPEIPQNTGNISRTCAAIGAHLHLIEPLGFKITDAQVKRAGLDYWEHLKLSYHKSLAEFLQTQAPAGRLWLLSTKGVHTYSGAPFEGPEEDCYVMFGRETAGLPTDLLEANRNRTLRIPMLPHIRSLNLSNAVAIVAYEIMKRWNFAGLEERGILARNETKE